MDRRSVLANSFVLASVLSLARGSLAGNPALAGTPAEAQHQAFNAETVKGLAQQLAASDYVKPGIEIPEPFDKLSYDQYRDIRFRPDQAIWKGEKLDVELQLFPMGWLYMTAGRDVAGRRRHRPPADRRRPPVHARAADRQGHRSGALRLFRLSPAWPAQPGRLFRRVCRLPGRELFARRRPRPELWRLGARPRHQYGAAGRRRVSVFPRLLDREAEGGRCRRHRPRAARQPVRCRRLSLYHQVGRGDRDGRRGDTLSPQGHSSRRHRAADQHVPARPLRPAPRRRLPPRRARQRGPCRFQRLAASGCGGR